jgi:hypothetical protein
MKLPKCLSEKKVDDFMSSQGDSYFKTCDDYVNIIRKDWDKKGIVYTDKDIIKSKHPNKVCAFCDQLGCDIFVKKYGVYYHKKCFRYLIKKSLLGSPKILKDTVIKKKE